MASLSACAHEREGRSSPGVAGKDASVSPPEAPKPDQRFPRSCRLTNRRQFLAVYGRGRRVSSSSFTLFCLPNSLDHCRLGVTVSRKTGGAVRRNRCKRLLREVFRRHRRELSPALDLVVNAHPALVGRTLDQIEDEFLQAFGRLARSQRR